MKDASRPATAAIDHNRRSVSVPRRLMPVVLSAHAGKLERPSPAITELCASGLMHDLELDPLAAALIEVMTDPTLVVTVEVSASASSRLATIWGTPHRAVIGTTDDSRRFDLMQIEPGLLPFHLAQATNLAPVSPLLFTGGFSLPATALDQAEDLATTDLDMAADAMAGMGTPKLWINRLLTALIERRSLWTVESVWVGGGRGRSAARLSVLDAGAAGYWRLSGPGNIVRVDVTNFDDIMHRFSALLPGGPAHR